jgi:hypothetical protein
MAFETFTPEYFSPSNGTVRAGSGSSTPRAYLFHTYLTRTYYLTHTYRTYT